MGASLIDAVEDTARRYLPVQAGEGLATLWAFAYFFCLLGGYYILRPVRDTMGIVGGIDSLPWLFSATFIAMLLAVPLYGWVSGRYPRRVFIPAIYLFFIACLLLFYGLFRFTAESTIVARSFFVWTSVYNLFVVSVFWSFMADLFAPGQANRLFAFIAAGGTTGAIAGPMLTTLLAPTLGNFNLLIVSALMLGLALVCVWRLRGWRNPAGSRCRLAQPEQGLGGSSWEGLQRLGRSPYLLGIGAFIVLYTMLSTFLYFEQAHIVARSFVDDDQRTRVFAAIDLAVNVLTIILQLFISHRLIRRYGVGHALAIVPLVCVAGFLALGLVPSLFVLAGFQVLRRAGNYAVTRPARESLFVAMSPTDRYKSKSVLDTVVYRGGDAVSGWLFAALTALGLGLSGIAFVAIPLASAWAVLAYWLARQQKRMEAQNDSPDRQGAN